MKSIVLDGCTLEGLIPAKPGLYGSVRFRYRVALPEEVDQHFLFPAKSGKEHAANTARLLKEHLEGWDVPGPGDQPLPITEDVLRRIHHSARQVLLDYVTGYAAQEAQEKN